MIVLFIRIFFVLNGQGRKILLSLVNKSFFIEVEYCEEWLELFLFSLCPRQGRHASLSIYILISRKEEKFFCSSFWTYKN